MIVFFRFIQSFLFAIATVLVAILGLIMVPLALLQMDEPDIDLPNWAWWWGNDKDHDGDTYWKTVHYPNGTHTSFFARFTWFALRNHGYNFGMRYGSFYFDLNAMLITDSGNPLVSNRDADIVDGGISGYNFRVAKTGDDRIFPMIYFVRQYFSTGRCFELYIGWKLRGVNNVGDRIEPVFRINPLMGFEKVAKSK